MCLKMYIQPDININIITIVTFSGLSVAVVVRLFRTNFNDFIYLYDLKCIIRHMYTVFDTQITYSVSPFPTFDYI